MPDDALMLPLAEARALLRRPAPRRERVWPALAAAGFFALSALAFAGAAILAPPAETPPAAAPSLRGAN